MAVPPAALSRLEPFIQSELRALLKDRTQPLYRMVEYQLGWADEHGAPANAFPTPYLGVACALACEGAGKPSDIAIPAAAAVVLAQQYVRVHEDIQDGAPAEGSRSPVWWVWGPAQAINAGDGLHALARIALIRLGSVGVPPDRVLAALSTLDEAALGLCEAQHTDLGMLERLDVSLETYVKIAEGRGGALLGGAMALGCTIAGAPSAVTGQLQRAGSRLGLALQARTEVAALWGEDRQSLAAMLLNKRKTLPFVLAFTRAPPKEKRELGMLYQQRVLEPGDLSRLAQTLDALGGRRAAEEYVTTWAREAGELLAASGLPAQRLEDLRALFSYLLEERSVALR
jgi:geranylgeranyl diphosphate synthase type I